jgi:hypothetical protein
MLKKYISLPVAAYSIIALLGLRFIIQLVIFFRLASGNLAADTAVQTTGQQLTMGIIALFFSALMIFMVLVRMDYVKAGEKFRSFSQMAMWIIFVFFLLNFVSTLTSPIAIGQKVIFGALPLLISLFSYRLAVRD